MDREGVKHYPNIFGSLKLVVHTMKLDKLQSTLLARDFPSSTILVELQQRNSNSNSNFFQCVSSFFVCVLLLTNTMTCKRDFSVRVSPNCFIALVRIWCCWPSKSTNKSPKTLIAGARELLAQLLYSARFCFQAQFCRKLASILVQGRHCEPYGASRFYRIARVELQYCRHCNTTLAFIQRRHIASANSSIKATRP